MECLVRFEGLQVQTHLKFLFGCPIATANTISQTNLIYEYDPHTFISVKRISTIKIKLLSWDIKNIYIIVFDGLHAFTNKKIGKVANWGEIRPYMYHCQSSKIESLS